MKKMLGWLLLLLIMVPGAQAAEMKVYPGAKPDLTEAKKYQAVKAHSSPVLQKKMGKHFFYTTADEFDKVYAFYKALYQETDLNIKKINSPLGEAGVQNDAYFCLDRAGVIAKSKHWLKLQHPYVGVVNPGKGHKPSREIRDVTGIIVVEKE
jgi:hypothetical protein